MRFIHLFLIGYFIVIVGVGLALWQAGVFNGVAPMWIGIGAIVAVGLGIMLSVSSGKPLTRPCISSCCIRACWIICGRKYVPVKRLKEDWRASLVFLSPTCTTY